MIHAVSRYLQRNQNKVSAKGCTHSTPHSAHYLVGLALVRPARPLLDLLDPGLDGGVQVEEARPQGARPVGVLQVQRGRHDAQGLAVHSAADTAVQIRAANDPSVPTITEKVSPIPNLMCT